MRFIRVLPVLVTFAAALAVPAPAMAAERTCVAPPGTAAVDEYCETLPSTTGERGTRDTGRAQLHQTLSKETVRVLTASGPAGRTLLRTPAAARHKAPHRRPSAGRALVDRRLLDATVGSATSGPASEKFVLSLLAATLVLVGIAWVRFRRKGRAGQEPSE